MTALLVSVRSAAEATEALAGGADIIDIKEPTRGALGMANPETWVSVRETCSAYVASVGATVKSLQLSAACGELISWESQSLDALRGFAFAKIGLAGCRANSNWQGVWAQWASSLPLSTTPVAVLYGDYRRVEAPGPSDVIAAAREPRCDVLLIDTFEKTNGNLFAHLAWCELDDIIHQARENRLRVALAGSIDANSVDDARRFDPDWIAVRGAVCAGDRNAHVQRERVKWLSNLLSTPVTPNTSSVPTTTH